MMKLNQIFYEIIFQIMEEIFWFKIPILYANDF